MEIVTTLYENNANDIPAMLRKLADLIDKEEPSKACAIALELEDGTLYTYGYGPGVDEDKVAILFERGKLDVLGY